MRSNKGRSLKFKLKFLKLKNGLFPRRIKLALLKSRLQLRREDEVGVATYAMRRVTLLLHAQMVPYPTPLLLMMIILFGRIRLAMCLPNMLVLKVVSRKEPFGLPSLL